MHIGILFLCFYMRNFIVDSYAGGNRADWAFDIPYCFGIYIRIPARAGRSSFANNLSL